MSQNKEPRTDILPQDCLVAIGWDKSTADKFLLETRPALLGIGSPKYSAVGSSSILKEQEDDNYTAIYIPKPLSATGTALGDFVVEMQKPLVPTSSETGATPESITNNWQLLANSNLSAQSYLLILKLAGKKDGWRGLGSKSLDSNSLSNLLKFWNKVCAHATEPEFALAPNGNIQAEWYKDERHFLEIKFTPLNIISFGLFHGDKVLEGITAPNDIIAILSSHEFKPLQWSYEG